MRFDLISIFPDYFAPLRLSLMGKAEDAGLVHLQAHDLRDWATGKHRSVDDTPYGGGAGMVMRADVWARALDDVLSVPLADGVDEGATASPRRILAIPTPSGTPLTQPRVEDLARADQIIVACGRYEGIDARVAEHYRSVGVEVVEFSIGDYVLNGGEVAAMVLTEAVARLLDGFMGNPDSLVEESHSGAGLLEYPVFTKPREFRSLEIPEVLLGGNHAAIERWRRDRAIEKTARVRPDLALSLDASSLTREDRAMLARCGVAYPRSRSTCDRLSLRTSSQSASLRRVPFQTHARRTCPRRRSTNTSPLSSAPTCSTLLFPILNVTACSSPRSGVASSVTCSPTLDPMRCRAISYVPDASMRAAHTCPSAMSTRRGEAAVLRTR